MPLPALNRRHKVGLFLVLVAAGISLILETSVEQTAGAVLLGIAAAWAFGSLGLRTLGFLSCFLVCASGLGILGVPVWQDWSSYQTSIQDYDSAITELQEGFAKAPIEAPHYGPDMRPWRKYALRELKDPDFFKASPADQRAYLSQIDPEFAKAPHTQQDAYLAYITHAQKTLEIPERALRWERPDAPKILPSQGTWVDLAPRDKWDQYAQPSHSVELAADLSDKEFLDYIQSRVLLPRPTFSIRGALFSHRLSSLIGLTLLVAGLIGNWLLFFLGLRKSRREAWVLPS